MPPLHPQKTRLDLKAMAILLVLCALWGGNMAAIKISNQGMEPIFTAGLRSAGASLLMLLWILWKKEPLFPPSFKKVHALMVGIFFGLEFCFIYLAQRYTLATRSYIFLYTHPFWVALGAHYLIPGDRITWGRFIGLVLAFLGLVFAFSEGLAQSSGLIFFGDFLIVLAALGWAATTLYIKHFLIRKCSPFQTLLYQLLFSAPVLFLISFLMEKEFIRYLDTGILLSFFFQTVIVAFLSYWAWFYLIHIYPVTSLAAFSFLTPIFGVFISSLILQEPITLYLLSSLGLVSAGIYLVNKGR
jgi:drug/metabolite transporter (DMT)-like permease